MGRRANNFKELYGCTTTKLIHFFITPQGLEAALLEGPELQIRDITINKLIYIELYNIYIPDYL